jgi:RNA polymerase sigma factor (sigma-70 family)
MESDAQLLTRYAGAGDEAAFAELVARHGPMVYRVCLRRLGDAHEAEDAAQAAFVVLARKAAGFRPGADLAAWLHGIAQRAAGEAARARTRRARREEEAAMLRAALGAARSAEPGDGMALEALDAGLAALSAAQRQAVLLRYVEGRKAMFWMKVKVAAAALGAVVIAGGGGGAVAVRLAAGEPPKVETAATEKGIECRVLEVSDGGTRFVLSAGDAQGVRKGFRFEFYRDGRKLGATADVQSVAAETCIASNKAQMELVRVGDTARTRFAVVVGEKPIGEKPPPPAEAGKVAWGQAVDGLQAGLVPLGDGAAKDWTGFLCPACVKKGQPLDKRATQKCPSCESGRVVYEQFCVSCAVAKRVCQGCGAAKPWGATFAEGEPLVFEIHLRNVGEEPKTVVNLPPSFGGLLFKPSGGGLPRQARYSGPVPSMYWGHQQLVKGGQVAFVVKCGGDANWQFEDATPAPRDATAAPVKLLPAGRYTVTALYKAVIIDKGFWRGEAPTGAAEIEIRAKGAAVAKGGEAVNGLSLRLEAARTEYRQGEPLDLRVFLDNVGDQPLVVLKRTTHVDMGIEAYDAQRQFIVSLLPPAPPPRLAAGDLAPLAAGASLELKDWEMLVRVNREIQAGHGRAGRFTIRASYRAQAAGDFWNVRRLDPAAWVGALQSNAVEVEIKAEGAAAGAPDEATARRLALEYLAKHRPEVKPVRVMAFAVPGGGFWLVEYRDAQSRAPQMSPGPCVWVNAKTGEVSEKPPAGAPARM